MIESGFSRHECQLETNERLAVKAGHSVMLACTLLQASCNGVGDDGLLLDTVSGSSHH
jgi:hypothetical protein